MSTANTMAVRFTTDTSNYGLTSAGVSADPGSHQGC
jgi:hypothetical protein